MHESEMEPVKILMTRPNWWPVCLTSQLTSHSDQVSAVRNV